jgi:hypothetical protein
MTKAATLAIMTLLAAAALVAGCSAAARPGAGRHAGSAIELAGKRVNCSTRWRQASTPLPTTFLVDSAVLCPLAIKPVHGSGSVVFIEQVADHGLAPLLAALRRPSVRPSAGLICPAQLVTVAPLFFINAVGQVIRPAVPTDACGRPLPQVLDALQHVPWITVHP